MSRITIKPAPPFLWRESLKWLARSADECLFIVDGEKIHFPLRIDAATYALSMSADQDECITVTALDREIDSAHLNPIKSYVTAWLDLDRDLGPFYRIAGRDPLLGPLVKQYRGLHLVGIPDLFEALCWSIIGQQINLGFAYRLKRRLTEQWGNQIVVNGFRLNIFPRPRHIAGLTTAELRPLQFSERKAEYLIGMAKRFDAGTISLANLAALDSIEEQRAYLMGLRGIGPWTADYVLMKTLRTTSAFPIGDAGLQNALRRELKLDRKPTVAEIRSAADNWPGWEAYATFYLWRSSLK